MSASSQVTLFIDPPSPHFLQDRLFDVGAFQHSGDNLLAPYVRLREFLGARGVSVHTVDCLPAQPSDGVRNVYISFSNLGNYRRLAGRTDVIPSAYVSMECPIVEPGLYSGLRDVERVFKRIFTWSDSASLAPFVGGPLRCETFCWPQSFDDVHADIWRREGRKFLVMINSNKLPRLYRQELYTERLKAVAHFSQTGDIDLYGMGWDKPSFRVGTLPIPWTLRKLHLKWKEALDRIRPDPLLVAARRVYRGKAASKRDTLGEYTFALCFENMIMKGWITEKIFDCFFSGTVPVYWGAPDVQEMIPSACYIDMRQFSGYEELRGYLKSLTAAEVQRYKEAARDFLRSPAFYPFSIDAFVDLFARVVEEDTGLVLGGIRAVHTRIAPIQA